MFNIPRLGHVRGVACSGPGTKPVAGRLMLWRRVTGSIDGEGNPPLDWERRMQRPPIFIIGGALECSRVIEVVDFA